LKQKNLKPIFEIIDEVTSDWKFWERYWIQQFKTWGFSLTNATLGGEGLDITNSTSFKPGQTPWNKGISPSLKVRDQISSSLKGSISSKRKKVCQYSKEGDLLNTFDSLTLAAIAVGGCNSKISMCCRNKRKEHKNFAWKYSQA
jgi:hypothetical protein